MLHHSRIMYASYDKTVWSFIHNYSTFLYDHMLQ